MKKIAIILSIIAAGVPAFSVVEQTIDEKRPMEVRFSTTSHNRIFIEGGGVEKLFGDASVFSVNIDPSTGNAFVNVIKPIENQLTLTVISDSGTVQDLLVSAGEGPSEQIVLKEKESESVRQQLFGPSVDLLNKIIDGKAPLGYGQRELNESGNLILPDPLQTKIMASYEGPFEIVTVHEIKNRGSNPITLTEEAVKQQDNSWVLFTARKLAEDEKSLCIIGTKKDD